MINHMVNECSKLVQKEYKTSDDWVWTVIPRESYKKLKFDHTTKLYMHTSESVEGVLVD